MKLFFYILDLCHRYCFQLFTNNQFGLTISAAPQLQLFVPSAWLSHKEIGSVGIYQRAFDQVCQYLFYNLLFLVVKNLLFLYQCPKIGEQISDIYGDINI